MNASVIYHAIFETDGISEFDVEVIFDYEDKSYTDHPYGEGTAREYHDSEFTIFSIKTFDVVNQLNEDGTILKSWDKNTDINMLPGWDYVKRSNLDSIDQCIDLYINSQENDDQHRIDDYISRNEDYWN